MAQHPSSDTTIFLDQPPSCLQFHPSSPNHFLVGTYLLSEHKEDDSAPIQQTKTGSLQLWHLDPATNQLTLRHKHPLPYAVFDLHFHPTDPTLAAIATSAASVVFFRITVPEGEENDRTPFIKEIQSHQVHEDPSIPALYLAWLPAGWHSTTPSNAGTEYGFAVTFSDGLTTLFNTKVSPSPNSFSITEESSYPATQQIEVWYVAAATYPQPHSNGDNMRYIFTGSDFGSLHTRYLPAPSNTNNSDEDNDEANMPILSHDDRARHHTAGVTAILPLPVPMTDGAPWLLTGSYDESLRVYHASRRGEVLGEIGLGGGVWRLQILSTHSRPVDDSEGDVEWTFLVLASCMHAGTRVVKVRVVLGESGQECEMEVVAEFTEHESMNYASDVWNWGGHKGGEGRELKVVSSSFYDRRVCVWRVNV
ncbi:hypothetical protein CBS63078_9934 [Aspergillus niger]|nr:hypothetical protein CBS133816_7772 [Aspergillus niger]KAI2834265.1 hypothetical protein CBS11350_10833 [Aspergillus niger]KAI2874055.1 hypothetical protein CBS11852_10712 [Aspergillus niger]KAI2890725.1 hypothetical protein CBS63078_9934 [Aspergillus niger]KAI2908140.1 hypothetical protein CBS147371_10319 [Aspergillus niger]